MEQLELTVTLKKTDDPEYPHELFVTIDEKPDFVAWYRGKTVQETLERFYKSFTESKLKYWHLLEDK